MLCLRNLLYAMFLFEYLLIFLCLSPVSCIAGTWPLLSAFLSSSQNVGPKDNAMFVNSEIGSLIFWDMETGSNTGNSGISSFSFSIFFLSLTKMLLAGLRIHSQSRRNTDTTRRPCPVESILLRESITLYAPVSVS